MDVTLELGTKLHGGVAQLELNTIHNKSTEALITAYNRGYRVINGILYNKNGKPRKGSLHKTQNRLRFSIYVHNKYSTVPVSRLAAYQKFGNKIFEPGMQVRHLDGNSLNNLDKNIELGTQSQNMMDIPEKERKEHSILATTHHRRFTDNEMEKIRNYYKSCHSYKKTKIKFNISSSGTLWNMLNVQYQTKV